MILVYILSVISLTAFLIFRYRTRKFRELRKVCGLYINSVPVLGMAYHLLGNNEDRMKGLQYMGLQATKAGGVAAGWLGPLPYVVVSDPVAAEVILKECLDKDSIMKILKELIGNGLIIAPLSVWRSRRKVVVPTFVSKNLKEFVKIFYKQSQVMVEKLESNVGKGPFSIWKYLASNNMDSVSETVFGVPLNIQNDEGQVLFKIFNDLAAVLAQRLCQPWLHSNIVYQFLPQHKIFLKGRNALNEIVDKIIKQKNKDLEDDVTKNEKGGMRSFLRLLIESSALETSPYNAQELREETLTLTIAGTDTSAAGVAFVLLALSKYQDVQEKAYKEIVQVFGDSIEEDCMTMDNLKNLVYLEAAIKEGMRLYTPVPVVLRNITHDVTLPSGLVVPAGCGAMISVWAAHRNKKYWGEDAEDFRPERFLDTPFKHPAQYMAFSYGPRNCPGGRYAMLSMKTVLSMLLHRYRVLGVSGEPRLSFELMMKDADGFQVQLEPRNNIP